MHFQGEMVYFFPQKQGLRRKSVNIYLAGYNLRLNLPSKVILFVNSSIRKPRLNDL